MSYKQLTEMERHQIRSFLKAGYTQKAIAQELGRNPGTISRELRAIPACGGIGPSRLSVLLRSTSNATLGVSQR